MDFKREIVIFLENDFEKYAKVVISDLGNDTYDIVHTYVSDDYRGKGLASKLVDEAVKYIKSKNGKIMTSCSYAMKYTKEQNIETIPTGKAPSCSLKHILEDN